MSVGSSRPMSDPYRRADRRAMPDVAGVEFPLADLDASLPRRGRPESARAAARVDAVARVSRPGHGGIFRRFVAAVALGVCAVVLWPSIHS